MGAILNMMARIGVTKKVTSWEVGGAAPRSQAPCCCLYKALCTSLVWPRLFFALWVGHGTRGYVQRQTPTPELWMLPF